MQDEMTINERRKYVKLMSARYRTAKRKERSQLLSEMEQVTKMHRKSLTRLLNEQSLERKKPTRCATRCRFQAKWLWTALRRIDGCYTETELLQHRQQASDVAEIAYESVSYYAARLLSSRCATRGEEPKKGT